MGHNDFDKMNLDSPKFLDEEVYNAERRAHHQENQNGASATRSRKARLDGRGFTKCGAHGVAHIFEQEHALLFEQPGQAQTRV